VGDVERGPSRTGSKPTVTDVAAIAGVSFATAARALGGYGYVSAKARERVEAAAAEVGYRSNDIARALASGSTRTVGLVVGDIENPFFATVSRGLADVLEPEGYTLLLANSDEDPEREARAVDAFRTRVDGLVIAPAVRTASRQLASFDKPVVLLDRTVEGLDADRVRVNDASASSEAVRHLLALGHRRIGVVSATGAISSTSQRTRGYRAALRKAGIEPDETLIERGSFTRAGGREAALRLLDREDPPTAVFTLDSFMTSGFLTAARELGLSIPDDVALVGFDDTDWMPLIDPPVTVMAQPVLELGHEAGRLLLRRLGGDTSPARAVQLKAELVVRGSCGEARLSTAAD
jgi:LacI family transcriptional regulator